MPFGTIPDAGTVITAAPWLPLTRPFKVSGVMKEAKIAALKEEIESIRFADALYRKRGKDCSREASAEYQRRQDRLPKIRSALALLEIPTRTLSEPRVALTNRAKCVCSLFQWWATSTRAAMNARAPHL